MSCGPAYECRAGRERPPGKTGAVNPRANKRTLSERGQTVSETVLQQYLHRIEYGKDGFASRLHLSLYTASGQLYEPRHVMIDPTIAFGKPWVKRLGVKTDIMPNVFSLANPSKS